MRNSAVICLGGNAPETETLIRQALDFIAAKGDVVAFSGIYRTEAENGGHGTYLNSVLRLATDEDSESFRTECKEYERGIRSHASDRLVNIDIDIVIWNDEVLRPADASATYFRRGFEALEGSSE